MSATNATDFDALPSAATLDAALSLGVDDEQGSQRPLGGLVKHGKVLVVFIRHFHCGDCQNFLTALAEVASPEALAKENVKLVVVGCGHWSLIAPYKEVTGCRYDMYADPSRKLYEALGMTCHISAETISTSSSYTGTFTATVKQSITNAWKMGLAGMWKGGKLSQNGGEWWFVDGKVEWVHRMEHFRDHTDPTELAKRIGVVVM